MFVVIQSVKGIKNLIDIVTIFVEKGLRNLNLLIICVTIIIVFITINISRIGRDKLAVNRGKSFENEILKQLKQINGVSVDRVHDQTTGFRGSKNICDIIAYRYPNQFYFECKTVHGNVLPFSNISDNQWEGLLEKSTKLGVFAGVICWWVDKGITAFIPIALLYMLLLHGKKSIRYDCEYNLFGAYKMLLIKGKKKRVFFDYDLKGFLNELQSGKC